jgi:predicted amidophosphoribosyltransferase
MQASWGEEGDLITPSEAYPAWELGAVIVFACSIALSPLIFGGRREVEYDCDLCGRHVKTKGWECGKAAAGHVCGECSKHEDAQRRHYAAIDRRK